MFSSQISMSSAAQLSISWESYKNWISKGFSRLQQNGEFVDMTLAAEGHLVKVHQNIVALASPYLKAMIQSAPCQHPVVFLNNITQEMLSFILEYIYTGEVNIPTGSTPAFIDACKALYINGVENLHWPKKPETESKHTRLDESVERVSEPPLPPDNNFAAHITINSDNFNVEVIPNENNTAHLQTQNSNNYNVEVIPNENNTAHLQTQPIIPFDNDLMNYQVLTDANVVENQNNFEEDSFPPLSDYEPTSSPLGERGENQSKTLINSDQNWQNLTLNRDIKEIPSSPHSTDKAIAPSIGDRDKGQHYSLSNRGALQLLLNRFMYYCHHHSCGGRKRRWRCIDYRKLHCPAYIDTDSENIINRSEHHSHSNHDTKVLRKFKSKKVFTSLSQVEDRVTEKPKVKRRKTWTQRTT